MRKQNLVGIITISIIFGIMAGFSINQYYEENQIGAHAEFSKKFSEEMKNKEQFVNWGIEVWECGRYDYVIQIGDDSKNVFVTKVSGVFSASHLPNANLTNGYVRQSLSSVIFQTDPSQTDPGNSKVISSPSHERWNHSLTSSILLHINIKQTEDQVIHLPIKKTFEANPVFIQEGKLTFSINTETYDGNKSVLTEPVECLNTEVHLMIYYLEEEKN